MNIPQDLKYTPEHEWIRIEGDVATIGITDYAQGELGDIIFVEFPESGDSFETGDTIGTVEAVKTVADIFTPLSGEISEINTAIEDTPDLVNSDPYGEGWLVKIKLTAPEEIDVLLDAAGYEGQIG